MSIHTSDYRVSFTAEAPGLVEPGTGRRLSAALASMPGAGRVEMAHQDVAAQTVGAGFVLAVRLGMAEAARDGSRLAKEGLKVAGLGSAQLIELRVVLGDAPTG